MHNTSLVIVYTDYMLKYFMMITRGKGGWREVGEGKGGIKSDGRRLDLGW